MIYADSTMVAVHAVKPGPRRIRLPGRFDVEDVVSGRPAGQGLAEIAFDVVEPSTRWWQLSEPHDAPGAST